MKQIVILIIVGFVAGLVISLIMRQAAPFNDPAVSGRIDNLQFIEKMLAFASAGDSTCAGGKEVDYYFDKNNLSASTTISRLDIPQSVKLEAISSRHCDKFRYGARVDEGLRELNRNDFGKFISDYDSQCRNCLLVRRTGPGQPDFIFVTATGKRYCVPNAGDVIGCKN